MKKLKAAGNIEYLIAGIIWLFLANSVRFHVFGDRFGADKTFELIFFGYVLLSLILFILGLRKVQENLNKNFLPKKIIIILTIIYSILLSYTGLLTGKSLNYYYWQNSIQFRNYLHNSIELEKKLNSIEPSNSDASISFKIASSLIIFEEHIFENKIEKAFYAEYKSKNRYRIFLLNTILPISSFLLPVFLLLSLISKIKKH